MAEEKKVKKSKKKEGVVEESKKESKKRKRSKEDEESKEEEMALHDGPVESKKEIRKRKKLEAQWKESGMSEEEIQKQVEALHAKRERKQLKKSGALKKDEDGEEVTKEEHVKGQKKGEHGVWVGNLSYSTTREQIKEHFKDCGELTRLNLPKASATKSVGYCYIDFATEEEVQKALALSESYLDRRAILVKNASDFTVKEDAKTAKPENKLNTHPRVVAQPNRPTPTLFVGNLSFDADRESLKQFFSIFGKVMNVRLSQWEDSGRCKG